MSLADPFTKPDLTDHLREQSLAIFQAGVAAADPYQAVKNCLFSDGRNLEILLNVESGEKRLGHWSRVHLIAFGKGACAMAKAAQELISQEKLASTGIAVTNYENVTPVAHFEVLGAGHPLPDSAGMNAAKKCLERLRHTKKEDLVLVLISGGGSALLPYPVEGIELQEKVAVTNLLLASGATINQINCVRKHLSQIKGGHLARLAWPADVHALILSDVLGDDLSAISSGPTVPDTSTYAEAIEVLTVKKLWHKMPGSVRQHLEQGRLGLIPETPKAGDPAFTHTTSTLIGSNAISVKAMLETAKMFGYQVRMYSDKLSGEAKDVAEQLVMNTKQLIEKGLSEPLALLAGGETTVTLTGNGRGGRNQELALAFALAAERHGLTGVWTLLSAGTDGRDGPTDAAGGIVDRNTLQRLNDKAINAQKMLDNNDSYHALANSQDLIITGATGTNVADLLVLLIHPEHLKYHA